MNQPHPWDTVVVCSSPSLFHSNMGVARIHLRQVGSMITSESTFEL